MRDGHEVYIALGSNLGDRQAALVGACALLEAAPDVRIAARSGIYETSPVGGPAGQGPYLNAVVRVITSRAPEPLLELALDIERQWGRQRTGPNAPRTLDVDLLLFDDLILDRPRLQLPHPRMHQRMFVLAPLAELAPDRPHPLLGLTFGALLASLRAEDQDVRRLPSGGWPQAA